MWLGKNSWYHSFYSNNLLVDVFVCLIITGIDSIYRLIITIISNQRWGIWEESLCFYCFFSLFGGIQIDLHLQRLLRYLWTTVLIVLAQKGTECSSAHQWNKFTTQFLVCAKGIAILEIKGVLIFHWQPWFLDPSFYY